MSPSSLGNCTLYSTSVLGKLLLILREGWPECAPDSLAPYWQKRMELTLEGDFIMWGVRVLMPTKLQQRVLDELHFGHPGMVRMKGLARSFVWWPGIDKTVEETTKCCEACQITKNAPPKAYVYPWECPTTPWERIHVDFAGPFLGKMLLVVMDAHSKWPEVCIMTSTTTAKSITVLREIFSRSGLPKELVSDNALSGTDMLINSDRELMFALSVRGKKRSYFALQTEFDSDPLAAANADTNESNTNLDTNNDIVASSSSNTNDTNLSGTHEQVTG